MRLVSYRRGDQPARAGILHNENVIDLTQAGAAVGLDLPDDLVAFLALEDGAAEALMRIGDHLGTLEGEPLDRVTLGPAIARPGKLLCLAGNYNAHIAESAGKGVNKADVTPRFFIKPSTAIIGTGDEIKVPPVSDTVDYEIEIAAVIGRRGRDVSVQDAEDFIAGYLVFNDISARHLKGMEHRVTRPMDDYFDWLTGKWCDTFAVVGPWLVTRDEVPEPGALEMSLCVNGELRQHSSAGEMIFSVPEAIAWISGYTTLEPGDLIAMGTPGGVGETTQTYLRPGDVVEGAIERLGTITNAVV